MSIMGDFHFLRPWWLLAWIPLIGLIWTMTKTRHGTGDWADYCDAALMPHVVTGKPSVQSGLAIWLIGLGGLIASLALAGPAWERLPTPVFRSLSAMVVVMDLSWAMEANDLKPSRLDRARYKIDDLLRSRKEGQTALVVYAGDAFTVTPLTDDVATIAAQLTALSPKIMPVQGARLDLGLGMASRLLQQAGQQTGDILVLTAGEEVQAAKETAARLKQDGYRVSVIGVGSRDGAPVPLPDGGFVKNTEGKILISRLDIKALWDLAQVGGGVYRTVDAGSADTDAVLEFTDRQAAANQLGEQSVHVDQWEEGGVWLLPLLIPLGALAFRRGWLGICLLSILTAAPKPSHAFTWKDLWYTPDQQAQQALRAGDAKTAAGLFREPAWKAAADYKAGAFGDAVKELEALDTASAHYNRGNALARQDRLEDALKAYDKALQLAPGDEDVAYNRKLVEDALKKKEKQDEQQDKDKQNKSEDGDSKDGQEGKQSQQSQKGQDQPDKAPEGGDQEQSQGQSKGQEGDQASSQQQQSGQPGTPEQTDAGGAERGSQASPDEGSGTTDSEPESKAPDDDKKSAVKSGTQSGEDDKDKSGEVSTTSDPKDEGAQAEAQWLRRIPDDPGGLLKRKFFYQYRLRQQGSRPE